MLQTIIMKNSYQDSVVLMLLTSKLNQLPEVERVSIMMGTPSNIDIFKASGFDTPELAEATSNDMVVMLEVASEDDKDKVLKMIDEELSSTNDGGGSVEEKINSWEKAMKKAPDANVALISIPGEYAALEIEKAIDNGLHAFVFSDNVPIEEEARLKQKAHDKGVLVMGPDCGTGVIHGLPLAFTNNNRKGRIGVIGASGTGIQEVTTLIHRYGQGVTNAIGTGGRDLSTAVGAISMIDSIVALNNDADTDVIIVISKPPAKEIEERVLNVLRKIEKPVVTLFLGSKPTQHEEGLYHAYTLEEAAQLGTKLMNNEEVVYSPAPAKEVALGTAKGIKGYYSGGTLAYEAAFLLSDALGLSKENTPEGYTLKSDSHEVIDLGDDMYTKGKPHPMIDPDIRIDKIKSVVDQPETAVVVFDVVLGYGAHEDMANALKPAIVEAKEKTDVTFVAVVVGTDEDRQNMSEQISILEEIGVIVCENNVQALQTALAVVGSKLTFSSKEVVAKQASTLEELPAVSSSLAELIAETPKIINIGLQSFTDSIIDNKGEVVHFEWRPSAGGNVELQKVLYFLNQYEFDAK
ncbi:acyl-CoA synthetase FdrA [Vagococcus fluvialis]|uniref:acyl-CoA synthetase FdrA n=1 Tax=Vagococcus fluvialis TaxID=2738 RepID=UPI001432FEA9|nr:acyl-CoA synthetase FdrA [Vagococcus fluvialis]MBO0486257.1 acyl-CoA synthetase FdrA [Vagococcus fluvialis]NKC60152.1 acyl-CoA synthetase FdrA [Vagococcus fluvialis]NKD51071.1 acyl-CoA synthetase FdrA [Vagococcus fluvialis]